MQANRVDLHPFKPADPVCVNLNRQWLIRVIDAGSPLVAQLEEFDQQASAEKAGIVLSGKVPKELRFPGGRK